MLRRVLLQRLLIGGVAALLLLSLIRPLSLQGWIKPVRIVSGSMAEALLGEHYRCECADCAFSFPYGVDSMPPLERATCPNCGFRRNTVAAAVRARGQRVMIDRGAYWFSAPRRFDVVAFRDPSRPDRLFVKRVVGLPGERLAIREGDLFADDQILRKSIADFRRMAVVVHDNNYLPRYSRGLPARWRPESSRSGWSAEGSKLRFTLAPGGSASGASEAGGTATDWITYHHWRGFASAYPRTAEAPVSDNTGYNQAESRELHGVSDLVVSFRLTSDHKGILSVRVHDGREWLELQVDSGQRTAQMARQGETLWSGRIAVNPSEDSDASSAPHGAARGLSLQVEFGAFDRQIVVAFDRQEHARVAYECAAGVFAPVSQPVAIGNRSLACILEDVRIYRDLYYLDPGNLGRMWERASPLDEDTFFVLGDNPSLSEDARMWKDQAIRGEDVLGTVIPCSW